MLAEYAWLNTEGKFKHVRRRSFNRTSDQARIAVCHTLYECIFLLVILQHMQASQNDGPSARSHGGRLFQFSLDVKSIHKKSGV